jgi:hypothetical protein
MSRFVNLEFGDESEDQSQPKEKALVKDEAYYFSEARAAFETGNFEQGCGFTQKSWNSIRKTPPRGPGRCGC